MNTTTKYNSSSVQGHAGALPQYARHCPIVGEEVGSSITAELKDVS